MTVVTAHKMTVISDNTVLGLCNVPTNCTLQTILAVVVRPFSLLIQHRHCTDRYKEHNNNSSEITIAGTNVLVTRLVASVLFRVAQVH